MSASGPVLPICALQRVGSYQGYTGCGADRSRKAANDPTETSIATSHRTHDCRGIVRTLFH
jgi:hypothetical protein